MQEILKTNVEPEQIKLNASGNFPNNPQLAVLIYRQAFAFNESEAGAENDFHAASEAEKLLKENDWTNSWRNGIYDFHHYHSNVHEGMAVCGGHARVILGGPEGKEIKISKGDFLVLPAGTAHKSIDHSENFLVVGAYPNGKDYDTYYGKDGERPETDENISKVSLPEKDPLYGKEGPLTRIWSKK